MSDLVQVQEVYNRYVDARNALLDELNLKRKSNRDPLSEFSEWLVAALVGGTRAENPVQKDWDVLTSNGEKIQVKYLANTNSAERWVNEHEIVVNEMMDSYAIVVFENLLPQAVIIFPARNLRAIGEKLKRRHKNLDTTLWFTLNVFRQIQNAIAEYKVLGMQLYLPPEWKPV